MRDHPFFMISKENSVNRLKLLFALGATVALLANQGCSSPAQPADPSQSTRSQAVTAATATLRLDVYPAALPGGTFVAEASYRDSSGNLLSATANVTVALAANPTAAKLGGTLTKAAVMASPDSPTWSSPPPAMGTSSPRRRRKPSARSRQPST